MKHVRHFIVASAGACMALMFSGFQPVAMSVGDAESFVKTDIERWARVIRDAGIKAD